MSLPLRSSLLDRLKLRESDCGDGECLLFLPPCSIWSRLNLMFSFLARFNWSMRSQWLSLNPA
jgi:hypothetical protein